MGQTIEKTNKHDYSKFKERYVIKKKLKDKKFGEGMVVEDINTKFESFLKEYTITSSFEFQNIYNKICAKEQIKNPYIIEIIDYFTQKMTHYCSEFFKLYILFEFCNKNLEMEVNDRLTDNIRHFSNEEMFYITESYITGLSFLQKNNISHSNLNLHSLLISKNGIYKLVDQTFLNLQSNLNQIKSKKIDTTGLYLSPEQIIILKNRSELIDYNPYKSDVFVLGICLIHAALLVPCDDLYNYEEFNFSAKALEQKFEAMRENYSNIFVNFLKLMTNEQEEMRLDFIGLNDQLDKILKMNKEDKKNPIFRKKTSDESLKLDKNIMNRLSKDLDLGINSYPQTSLIPFQNKRMTSNEILLNQWKFDPKLRETNLQASISKNPKINTKSFERITEAKEDSEICSNQKIDFDINDLLKQYGIQPLKPISRSLSRNLNSDFEKKLLRSKYFLSDIQDIQKTLHDNERKISQTLENKNFFDYTPHSEEISPTYKNKKPTFHTNKIESPFSLNNSSYRNSLFSNQNSKSDQKAEISEFINKKFFLKEIFTNGSKYEGEKKNGARNGYGKFTYPTGAYYEGEWKDNKKNGKGLIVDSDENTIYEGNFLDDKYHGKGTLYNQNINFFNEEFPYEDFGYLNGRWLRYEGMFSKDLKNGKGILFLSNGERFYGNFEQDYVNGPGTFYVNNGKIVHGVWKNDKFIDPS